MEQVSFVKFRQQLTDYIGQARYAGKRIVVTQRGKIVGAFVPIKDLAAIQSLEDKRDIEIFRQAIAHGEFEDWNEVKKRLLADQEASNEIRDQIGKKSGKISKKNPQKRSSKNHSSHRRVSRKSKTEMD